MKKNIIFATVMVAMFSACSSSEKQNDEDTNISTPVSTAVVSNNPEKKLVFSKELIYTINDTPYGLNSLPDVYKESSPEERKKFLNLFINNKIVLDVLSEKQHLYQDIIKKALDKEESEWKRRGITLDPLSKTVTVQKAILDVISYEEAKREDQNISSKVKQFYEDKKSEYHHENGVEISSIVLDNKEEAEKLLAKLLLKKEDIGYFTSMVKLFTLDKKRKNNGGYGGFITKKNSSEFFEPLWNSKETGVFSDIIEYKKHYFISFIHQRKEAGFIPFDEVKDTILRYLLEAEKRFFLGGTQKEILKKTKVKIYDKFDENLTF